ncbi:hypothetical protein KSS87_005775 [Heliosperma pusillum]|nr:hypothetical protein KSS87_005775 [Heliosperma pusillum]
MPPPHNYLIPEHLLVEMPKPVLATRWRRTTQPLQETRGVREEVAEPSFVPLDQGVDSHAECGDWFSSADMSDVDGRRVGGKYYGHTDGLGTFGAVNDKGIDEDAETGQLSEAILREMGQYVSRLDMDSDDSQLDDANSSGYNDIDGNSSKFLDNEIAHLTRLRSQPNEGLCKVAPGKSESYVSMVKMLARREANSSGRGRFTSADRGHAASRYLPVNGPWHIDQMNSRTYVSQFSTDGSLFISGFQGSHIRIYDVDNGWKVHKNIVARSLRWTITDTSLSPDQQHLVYSSMSPLVHIVDVGSAAKESLANVTDIHDGLDFSAYGDGGYSFGIFSVKFSTDGKELVAGSSDDAIYVYDLEANKLSLRILAHTVSVLPSLILQYINLLFPPSWQWPAVSILGFVEKRFMHGVTVFLGLKQDPSVLVLTSHKLRQNFS